MFLGQDLKLAVIRWLLVACQASADSKAQQEKCGQVTVVSSGWTRRSKKETETLCSWAPNQRAGSAVLTRERSRRSAAFCLCSCRAYVCCCQHTLSQLFGRTFCSAWKVLSCATLLSCHFAALCPSYASVSYAPLPQERILLLHAVRCEVCSVPLSSLLHQGLFKRQLTSLWGESDTNTRSRWDRDLKDQCTMYSTSFNCLPKSSSALGRHPQQHVLPYAWMLIR